MSTLLFDASGTCLKEIGGAAVPDIAGAIAVERPAILAGIKISRLRLVNGSVEVVPLTQEQSDTASEWSELSSVSNWKTVFRVLVWMVNEIRGLQGKQPITRQQALAAIAALPK